jgi:hypothetical protein
VSVAKVSVAELAVVSVAKVPMAELAVVSASSCRGCQDFVEIRLYNQPNHRIDYNMHSDPSADSWSQVASKEFLSSLSVG